MSDEIGLQCDQPGVSAAAARSFRKRPAIIPSSSESDEEDSPLTDHVGRKGIRNISQEGQESNASKDNNNKQLQSKRSKTGQGKVTTGQ